MIITENYKDNVMYKHFPFLKLLEPSKDHACWKAVQEGERLRSNLYENDPEWFLIYV